MMFVFEKNFFPHVHVCNYINFVLYHQLDQEDQSQSQPLTPISPVTVNSGLLEVLSEKLKEIKDINKTLI